MHSVTTIGLDIAKSVFQVHGVDAHGKVVVRRQLSADMFCHSSRSCHRAWLGSRLALRPTIGRASCRHSATLFD
jgi:transposase